MIPDEEIRKAALEELKEFNLMTECFFLTAFCSKIAFDSFREKFERRDYRMIVRASQSGDMVTLNDLLGNQHCLEIHIASNAFSQNYIRFLSFTGMYYLYNAVADKPDQKTTPPESFICDLKLPLKKELDPFVANIPEEFLENIWQNAAFLRKFFCQAYLTKSFEVDTLVTYSLAAITSPNITNPHLRAQHLNFIGYLLPLNDKEYSSEE